jgi:hypothetical protein
MQAGRQRQNNRSNVTPRTVPAQVAGLFIENLPTAMLYYTAKVAISALVIVAISEVAKRSSGFAALIASLPLTSLLAFIWLHIDGEPSMKIAELASQIFWLVIPSLILFLLLPYLIYHGVSFWLSLGVSVLGTIVGYFLMLLLTRQHLT